MVDYVNAWHLARRRTQDRIDSVYFRFLASGRPDDAGSVVGAWLDWLDRTYGDPYHHDED